MSELKVIDLGDIREAIENDESVFYEYYAKSEADKVIRRQKYKRCLAMAKWCKYWANYWKCCEPPDCSLFIAKAKYYRKWHNRWQRLAETLNPNKPKLKGE